MALLALFAAFLLTAAHQAVGEAPADFLSIDCGLEANYSGYRDANTGIVYVSDGPYVDSGENHRISDEKAKTRSTNLQTVRSFPSGVRNCYTLPTRTGTKYLVRLSFVYGNYDGKGDGSSSTLRFDLHLGPQFWTTVDRPSDHVDEAVFVAWASWAPVCLINTGSGTPFMSTVELRPLGDALYPTVMANQSMSRYVRCSLGETKKFITRYPDDPYDRYWWQMWYSDPTWKNISTVSTVKPDSIFAVPSAVMQTAVEAISNDTTINITWVDKTPGGRNIKLLLHFADFQNSRLRQFNASLNDGQPFQYSPPYLAADALSNTGWWTASDGHYSIRLVPTAASKLPPMINALEMYTLISHDSPATLPADFESIMAIKLEYGIKKNWMGDPCFPVKFAWEGVKCRTASNNISRIISLDLSNSNLSGVISNNFTLLTALEYLNLSCNQLKGPIPDSLQKNNTGSFNFSFDSDGYMCNKTIIVPSPPVNQRNKRAIIAISVVVPVTVIAALVVAFFIWRQKTRTSFCATDPPRDHPELENIPAERSKSRGDVLQKVENRQFSFNELEKFTNKFERLIGQGGFGPVYYGRLEDNIEVAVKMHSESSSHGIDEFFTEVQNLTKVHHKNLVSLVGYCLEKDHLALVYEYMVQGSLFDHLRGNNCASETLNWRTRVRVVVEAAQGLDYLHEGCSLPIIHRDVKSSNIFLSQNLQAKLADFGLSKTYLTETQTHISITAAETAGYIDPEYYRTGRLTESSDVYSFGIVLLEIATGESPILPGQGHIVQRVKERIAIDPSDIRHHRLVSDKRLKGAYDIISMLKVVNTALLCTADVAAERPTMASVVLKLKESLALEEARENSGLRKSIGTGW
ncbi:receptor-like protein kinase At3g21340 [Oryza brachyantha]|uniref:receptor-like protein kinase At3g21340 n=1 Tax=Oryza brachyantha TaxID=4533 RepID=UPI0007762C85|nr:receptor-like protein kinase At3g21340 [Oryza brachyantha]